MDNLELYEKIREVPESAKKLITGGRLNGMTDINPMWRIKVLTEQFGICGIGWKPVIKRTWLDVGANGEISANVEIDLFVKQNDKWSEAIPGIGGSKFISKESAGLYTDDECYKKAYTDALSVACKALGMGADVYFKKDTSTKYDTGKRDSNYSSLNDSNFQSKQEGSPEIEQFGKTKYAQVVEFIKNSSIDIKSIAEWIVKKFGKPIKINELTEEQFNLLIAALKKQIEKEYDE